MAKVLSYDTTSRLGDFICHHRFFNIFHIFKDVPCIPAALLLHESKFAHTI